MKMGRPTLAGTLLLVTGMAVAAALPGASPSPAFAQLHTETALEDTLCTNGTVITDHADKPDLVEDCKNLVAAVNHWRTNTSQRRWIPNWGAATAISGWEGVTVEGTPPRVTGLILDANARSLKLRGQVPSQLGNLSDLKVLSLSDNYLAGDIPASIWTLTKLTTLVLINNQLTGSIPAEVGNLTRLEILDLADNDMGGSLPSEIGSLGSTLRELRLHSNKGNYVRGNGPGFSGSIPSEFGNLVNLTVLQLHINILSGPIPDLSRLTKLQWLSLYENNLSGDLPSWLPQLTTLTNVYLYDNQLTGSLPAGLGNLSALRSLQLNDNRLTGTIPATLADPPLNTLKLNMNMFTGCIPDPLYDIGTNDMATTNRAVGYYDRATDSHLAADILPRCSEATPNIILNKTAFSVGEGGDPASTYSVRLGMRPTAAVTVAVSGYSSDDLMLDKPRLTFSTSDWHVEQTVTVSAPEDDDSRDETTTLTHTASGASEYRGKTASLDVTVFDNDSPGVTVATNPVTSPPALTLTEGGSGAYTVVLESKPSANVTVTVAKTGTSGITVNKSTLPFTTANWRTPQTVTVSAIQDGDAVAESATISHTVTSTDTQYAGISAASVGVTATDDDTPGVVVQPTSLALTEGGETRYTVVLTTRPSVDVTVNIVSGRRDVRVDQSSLTFTSTTWNSVRTVRVAKDEDNIPSGSGAVTITNTVSTTDSAYASVTAADVNVQVTDNDSPGVTIRPISLTVDEGGSETYTVVLATRPSSDVTVTIGFGSGSSPDVATDETTLTFTDQDWDDPQTVTVSAAEDDTDTANDTATITHTATSTDSDYNLTAGEVSVGVADNDQVKVKVDPTSLTVAEDGSATYTLVLGSRPSADVTVAIALSSTSSPDVTLTTGTDTSVTSFSVTFAPGDWDTPRTVTVEAVDDADAVNDGATLEHTVTSTDGSYNGVATDSVTVTVTDDDEPPRDFRPPPVNLPDANPAAQSDRDPQSPPRVSAGFEQSVYTVAEGSGIVVKILLSADPERSVTIPLVSMEQGGAAPADHSGLPANVTFDSGETEASFTFRATEDGREEDAESVKIAFGQLPDRVFAGANHETTVRISDGDLPAVTVSFERSTHTVAEGSNVTIRVALSADPKRTITVPFTASGQGGAGRDDYSGVPANVMFMSGQTEQSFTFTATQDSTDDDGESVRIGFRELPTGVTAGAPNRTTVRITDDDEPTPTPTPGTEPEEPQEPEQPAEPEEREPEPTPDTGTGIEPDTGTGTGIEPDTGTGLRAQPAPVSFFLLVVVAVGAALALAYKRR